MAPAGVEPAPCRLRVGSSPLSYGAEKGVVGRSRTCDAPRFRRPLSTELRPRDETARDGRGWIRTSDILFVGQALSAGLSYSPAVLQTIPERLFVVCMSRSAQAERCCSCHSPALRPWIARSFNRAASYVEGIWSRALLPLRKFAGKSSGLFSGEFSLREAQRGLSLLGGASSRDRSFSSWASLLD